MEYSGRKAEIISAAVKLFAKQGYHGTQLEQVARLLGLSKGAIYWYFPDGKKQVFLEACRFTVERIVDQMKQVMSIKEPFERIRKGLQIFFRFCKGNRHFVELIIHERGLIREEPQLKQLRDKHIGMLVETLEAARRKGLLRRGVEAFKAALVLSCAVFGALFSYLEGEIDLEEIAEPITDFILKGILKTKSS